MVDLVASVDSNAPRSRRRMLAHLAGVSAATGIGLTGLNRVQAQDATPPPTDSGSCGAPMNAAVAFKNVEGVPVVEITVSKLIDPFQGYNPTYPPPRGNRFILLGLKVENVGVNPIAFDPGRIFLQDADGFVIYPSNVDLGVEPTEVAIGYQEIPPGSTVEGVTGYVLIQGVMPVRAFYMPTSDRLLLLADLPRS